MKKLLAIIVLGLLWSGNVNAGMLPDESPEKQYKFASNFLKLGDYNNAEYAFKEFVETNSNHPLAGNAQYWYGETFRIRQRYKDAAEAYLDGYQNYPKSKKAPVNLLKLGMMMIELKEAYQGCTIIHGLVNQYPQASDALKKKASYEYKKKNCKVKNDDGFIRWAEDVKKKPKTVVKKPETSKPFAKSKLINEIKNAPNESNRNRIIYYFFAYTSSNDLYYGWAYPITMPNGKIKEFYGVANSVNYKTGKYNKDCNITSRQTKTSAPFQGNFDMECPNNKRQNIIGSWTQDQFDEPGLGSGFNKNGDQVSVFFALQKEILINSINSFNFDGVQEVKKPSPKKVVKKEPLKKQITKAPEVDGSLLTIGSGSGFYINSKGYALTNNHVVDICRQMVAVVDGKEILFRVIATDKTNDVAVIKADQRSPNFIKINEDGAKLGEDVIAVGYPLSGRLSDSVKITRGIVSALSGMNNNSGQIQIDAALQPGNSGGPVINETGDLVGIASAGLNKLLMAKEAKYIPENVNFAVSSSIVTNILKNQKVSYSTPGFFSGSYSNTELATLGNKVTLQLFCRNTRTAYNKLKQSKQYTHILIDLD